MTDLFRMCLNWKVLAGLAAVGVGIWVIAPNLILAALPLLVLAACPLSMLVMMWGMKRMMSGQHEESMRTLQDAISPEERLARL